MQQRGPAAGFLLTTFFVCAPVCAQDADYAKVRILCDAATGSMHIAEHDARESKSRNPQLAVTTINWGALVKMGPQKNLHGEPLRTGSNTATRRCGPYTVRIKAGYLNTNPMGESGAIEFPVVDIMMNKAPVVPPTALNSCEQAMPRYSAFGPCPEAWAQSIRVTWDGTARKSKVTLHRIYEDRSYEQRSINEEYEVSAAAK
jgi:hypothetical protein